MVSTRPSPSPAKGRVAYPNAQTYTPGDTDASPTYSKPFRVTSSDSDRETTQQGLKTWWKGFRERTDPPPTVVHRRVFGEPLARSLEYASVQISTAGEDGALYVWGVIPVVVAKCGLYLKEHGTEVEGAFRISGSAKRMRDLQTVFDTGPKYGKNIDWKTLPYSTHDVATIFRRFLTQMPEPIVPIDFFSEFRETLSAESSEEEKVAGYKRLIRELPPVHQYLLLYVLDLLHVFANNSDKNRMTAPNLALIFQPGMLSHPTHSMRPSEHVLSQQVLEFLIEHQDHFLIGMQLGRKRKSKKAKETKEAAPPEPASPQPPPMVRADADLMLPSDSDDEAPSGGYYVVEGTTKNLSPRTSPTDDKPSLPATDSTPVLESLIPTRVASSPSATKRNHDTSTTKSGVPTIAEIEPSDSDDDAPPGGYEVRMSEAAKGRAELLARAKSRRAPTDGRSETSSLSRRRTVPSQRGGRWTMGQRRNTKEAP